MRLQIASDLHHEFLQQSFPEFALFDETDADVLVLAGDIHSGVRGVERYRDVGKPVIYVHGNHEAYGRNYQSLAEQLMEAAAGSNVHYLERATWVHDGVRFLGCCLWTDYELDGDRDSAMRHAAAFIYDHRVIKARYGMETFMPAHALTEHWKSVAWLKNALAEPFDGKTVVVTHHGVTPQSVHAQFAGNKMNPAFSSDLTELVAQADLWIHGHTHCSLDYQVGKCRVIANPRGYPKNRGKVSRPEDLVFENPEFRRGLVVEI